jgi:GrpB-like predicted nucleotidyltransferase (UPF0157 family)
LPMAVLPSSTVSVVQYDPRWPALFAAERSEILSAFAPLQVLVEHVGSTAVPGLVAKPVIDILVGVHMAELTDAHLDALRLVGYGYVRARRGSLCLYRGRPRTFFVHIVEFDGPEWREKLLFRDYLRAHPEAVDRYARLKSDLAMAGAQIGPYAFGKRKLIVELMGQAKVWIKETRCGVGF